MSQYISSFFIEPVVRQARRFSRPSIHSTPSIEGLSAVEDKKDDEFSESGNGSGSLQLSAMEEDGVELIAEELSPLQRIETGRIVSTVDGGATSPSMDMNSSPAGRLRLLSEDSTSQLFETTSIGLGVVTGRVLGSPYSADASTASSLGDIETTPAGRRSLSSVGIEQGSLNVGMSSSSRLVDRALPEDDGMGPLRRRIIQIQNMQASSEHKSKLMLAVMNGGSYERHPSSFHSTISIQPTSNNPGHDRPFTPSSTHSIAEGTHHGSPVTSISSTTAESSIELTAEDIKPTYVPTKKEPAEAGSIDRCPKHSHEDTSTSAELGCIHYKRNVKLQCFDCHKWYTCRFCHDNAEDHTLNRRATRNMLCMLCGCAQPAAHGCCECGEQAARYYCGVCKLWDDDLGKNIYHCVDCGICRIGMGLGKDFFHCKKCSACIAISIQDTHRCIERSTDCDCPICGDYMFTSPQTVVFMPCGHSIHYTCYKQHMQNSFKCPICSRSIINMEMTFRQLDHAIEAQPMPAQFRDTRASIYCNDCNSKTSVPYHWLGLKCAVCDSYNTAQIRIHGGTSQTSISTIAQVVEDNAIRGDSDDRLLPEALEPTLRGRTLTIIERERRTASSASALESFRAPHARLRDDALQRVARSTSVSAITRFVLPDEFDGDGPDSGDAMDTSNSEDDDDVAFWGGESPRDRSLHAILRRRLEENQNPDDNNDDDDDDNDESDENLIGNDEDDEEDDDDVDTMEIFGHR